MSERMALDLTKKALFENAGRAYDLDIEPTVGNSASSKSQCK